MVRPADILFPDRQKALEEYRCIEPPIGCGKPIIGFRDEVSSREYAISALCQACQDEVFGGEIGIGGALDG
jgi:hypothetical protein